jgi:hypothetical protein
MKKFLAIVAIAAAFTACNEEKKAEGAAEGSTPDTSVKANSGDTSVKPNAGDTTAKTGVSGVIEAGKDAVKDAGTKAVEGVKDAGTKAVEGVKEAGKDAMKAVTTPEVKK